MLFGSLVNRLSGTPPEYVPTVGDGATELMYSDRHPFTIVKVTAHTVTVRRDAVTVTGGTWPDLKYAYAPDDTGETVTLRRSKRRGWAHGHRTFALGYRDEYRDPTF
jgi:hypothetical protein